jgi:IS30 family transposase
LTQFIDDHHGRFGVEPICRVLTEPGYRFKETPKSGPALAGYEAITMKHALADTMTTLPTQPARSLTWGRGTEMSAHAQFRVETGVPVFFADTQSPWQRGTNENTNGLLRQCSRRARPFSAGPRKTLGWKTPAAAFNEQLLLLNQAGVASAG